ncbi:phosphatidylglycerol:prolipoprotein diacylglycerol transferase [Butyrivibrio fibrisolvens DSM 3071]|uniref:Phosphatidylglycerol--prolipoprotein diacylglyceryl transferase n=1 Tax=Butyrivibrio fibrisolvens DSM 3071 TaxID=1121131 RepID=A0A1M5TV70_BUTFI|nr:prolipoprotein diacylglyceryl transferase [Butyrivibrio fibrisolvens]SHH54496.1 phosphatidylglycerol:prolipoprotein diacylglycerol transferase [Butyrivibrio fibrisolvens DSM 3071]
MPNIMDEMSIAFPHLGVYLKYVPKSFTVFGFTVAMYGLIIGIGVLCGVSLAAHVAKMTKQNPDWYWDLAIYLLIFSIMGARLYYVIFAWDYYKDDPIQILNIRNGGLAIYGGVIVGFITLAVYVKVKHKSYRLMADTGVFGVIMGQIIGRWGNFTNREAFGDYTDSLFAMRIPEAMVRSGEITAKMQAHMSDATNFIQVHPTFLYESLWNVMILTLMLLYVKHKKFHGEVALLYLGGYGFGRALVESLRTDQLHLPGTNLPVSQLLGFTLFALALITDVAVRIYMKTKSYEILPLDEVINEKVILDMEAEAENKEDAEGKDEEENETEEKLEDNTEDDTETK